MSVASAGFCSVCGLTASGYHFGALSCPGCNAFFRRSIAHSRRYLCHRSGHCAVAQHGKWYCRACRLKKCFERGMDPKAVQPQRDVLGQKRKQSDGEYRGGSKSTQTYLGKPSEGGVGDISMETVLHKSIKDDKTKKKRAFSRRFTIEQIMANSKTASGKVLSGDGSTSRFTEIPCSKPATRRIKTRPSTFKLNGFIVSKESVSSLRNGDSKFKSEMEQLEKNRKLNLKRLQSNSDSQPSTSSHLNHRPVYDASRNKIEILLHAYSRLRELRRLLFNRGSLRDLLDGSELPLFNSKIGLVRVTVKLDIRLIINFLNSFDVFSKLQLDDRVVLFKNGVVKFFALERHYITMRKGGFHSRRLINIDGSYYDIPVSKKEENGKDGATDEQRIIAGDEGNYKYAGSEIDSCIIEKLFLPVLEESLENLSGAMYYSGTTDVEFAALTFLLFLEYKVPSLSASAQRVLKKARDDMFRDWFAYYEAHSIPDGVLRMGNAICLLPEIYVAAEKVYENHCMAEMFNLFDYAPVIKEAIRR